MTKNVYIMISSLTNKGELLMETLEQRTELFHKERELEFKQAKRNITFPLRGDNKYYYAFQCAQFEKNLQEFGFDCYATSKAVKEEGLFFNKYSITLGHYYGHDLKRFSSKEEMFGFVVGYNEAVNNFKYYGLLEEK